MIFDIFPQLSIQRFNRLNIINLNIPELSFWLKQTKVAFEAGYEISLSYHGELIEIHFYVLANPGFQLLPLLLLDIKFPVIMTKLYVLLFIYLKSSVGRRFLPDKH